MSSATSEQGTATPAEELDHGRGTRVALAVVRIGIGLLWIQSAGWKTPPNFGQDSGTGLFKYTSYAVEYPVFPPFSWLIENLVLPNFALFGYLTLALGGNHRGLPARRVGHQVLGSSRDHPDRGDCAVGAQRTG